MKKTLATASLFVLIAIPAMASGISNPMQIPAGWNSLTGYKLAFAPSAPGSGACTEYWVAGTTSGTGKKQAVCGTSNTPVTLVDNVGGGF